METSTEPANSCSDYICNKSNLNTGVISLDEQSQKIKLNCSIPPFSYSAIILIQDFNGRILQTLNLNPRINNRNEFFVNDFLAGTYDYTLILDNQNKVYGKFTVKD